MSVLTRGQSLVVAIAIAVCLIGGSPPRLVGDGGEYLAQAINFSGFNGPALSRKNIPAIEQTIGQFDATLSEWRIDRSTIIGQGGKRDFLHFWFYALLATPALWLTNALGAPPSFAFALLNLALLLMALAVALPRIGGAGSLLLFAGPIVWWIDKAHTEVFTFALLVAACALMRERPVWAVTAAAAASTQNPPIAALAGLVAVAEFSRRPAPPWTKNAAAGIGVAGVLILLHPAYNYFRHGTPSLLLSATRPGVPTWAEVSAVVLDPSIGLVGNFPVFLLVVVAAVILLIVRHRGALASREMIVAAASAVLFLFAFARTANVHHGATPGLSRYALWLVPLAVPLLAAVRETGTTAWRIFLTSAATISAASCVFAFHPSIPQNSHEPTAIARWLWTKHPALNDPLPEVFMETQLGLDRSGVPVATAGCEKILVAGGAADDPTWPIPCYPAATPTECRTPGGLCYANRSPRGYRFAPAPRRPVGELPIRAGMAWPAGTEAHVRQIYEDSEWWTLGPEPTSIEFLRQAWGVSTSTIGSATQLIVVATRTAPEAFLAVRSANPITGRVFDPATGRVVAEIHVPGDPDKLANVPLPAGLDFLVVTLRLEPR